ncbi:hypothetical protein H8B01_37620, partial [Bradyrhizobium sp. Cham227]|nr:hypothetical protein [Bradyrhizobium brasilense]
DTNPRGITSRHRPAGPYHAQHPGFERGARSRRREHLPLEAGSEAVDEDAGRPEARQLDNSGQPELDQGPERHPFKVQSGGGDVLAEVAGANLEASFEERREEFEWDQVDLPEIGQTGLAACQIAVPDERAGVSVAFDALAFHQDYAVPSWFAEVVPAIGSDRYYPSLQREILLLRHQAARASERRFWRR